MTERAGSLLPRVAVCGADHAALALSLAKAGCKVVLLEPDPHDRARLADMITRLELPASFALSGDTDCAAACDVALVSGSEIGSLLDVPVLSLDWNRTTDTAVHLTELPGRQPLLECIGPDRCGFASRLGQILGARLVHMPRGEVPPSQRLLAVLSAEIEALALAGATPEDVDDALSAVGMTPGPFELQDILGIDTCLAARRAVFERLPGPAELPLVARAVAEGRLGRKVGVGWYRYPGGGGKVEDPLIEDMAIEEARFARIPRIALDVATIRNRLLTVLRAEVARIAESGWPSIPEIDDIAQLSIGAPARLMIPC